MAPTGWRRAALGFTFASTLSLGLNAAFIIWAMARSPADEGIGVLTTGKCSSIKTINVAIHVAINILSTVLLSGSNYCMQILSAPDRELVDLAHSERRWLDIGVPSIRNIKHISKKRRRLWWALGVSSVPLHLLYNSAVFSTVSSSVYEVTSVNEEMVSAMAPSKLTGLVSLDPVECISAYSAPFQTTHGDLLVVSPGNSSNDRTGSQTYYQYYAIDNPGTCDKRLSYEWMCITQRRLENCGTCDILLAEFTQDPSTTGEKWQPFGLPVASCLSQPLTEVCSLKYSTAICWTVVVLNLSKACLMAAVTFLLTDFHPLLTTGDAIASFLARPDAYTQGLCLLSKHDVTTAGKSKSKSKSERKRSKPEKSHDIYTTLPNPRPFSPQTLRSAAGTSKTRWAVCIALYLSALGLCAFLLAFGLLNALGRDSGAAQQQQLQQQQRELFGLGLGAVDAQTLVTTDVSGRGGGVLVGNAAVANAPQLILSLLYFTYNGLFTGMAVAREWSGFAVGYLIASGGGKGEGKGLRVSAAQPVGTQRGTYWLQLPLRLSVPLVVMSGVLHWLVSQSLFLVYVEARGTADDKTLRGMDFVTIGWSPVGLVCVLGLGVVLVTVLVVFALRRLRSPMPVAGSCSMAIAAACHPAHPLRGLSTKERRDWEEPLRWGVTSEEEDSGVGHCAFSSGPVHMPVEGRLYM